MAFTMPILAEPTKIDPPGNNDLLVPDGYGRGVSISVSTIAKAGEKGRSEQIVSVKADWLDMNLCYIGKMVRGLFYNIPPKNTP